ncbi:hypothetical protein KCP78_00255 [Salmonella enterica subsp. enterica]|nr:hypothetical protein KCP78_00255 [Salmonella enterica subsp. enterica]
MKARIIDELTRYRLILLAKITQKQARVKNCRYRPTWETPILWQKIKTHNLF